MNERAIAAANQAELEWEKMRAFRERLETELIKAKVREDELLEQWQHLRHLVFGPEASP